MKVEGRAMDASMEAQALDAFALKTPSDLKCNFNAVVSDKPSSLLVLIASWSQHCGDSFVCTLEMLGGTLEVVVSLI